MNLLDAVVYEVNADPSAWTPETWDVLEAAFYVQFAPMDDGWINPTVESVDETTIMFRCFYDNYDNDGYDEDGEYHEEDDDSWYFSLDRETGEFDR